MKKIATTPGPWRRTEWESPTSVDGVIQVVADARGCGLFESLVHGRSPRTVANARLAASAPALRDAMAALVAEWDATGRISGGTIEAARKALGGE